MDVSLQVESQARDRSLPATIVDTTAEKDKFFDDALFLATNLTDGQTFSDVLPVVNWWAGFSASAEVRHNRNRNPT